MSNHVSSFLNINQNPMYRYVSSYTCEALQDKISQLGPLSNSDLKSMQRYDFKSTVFLNKSWIFKAIRFLHEEKLSQFEYAALMLFDACKSHPQLKFLEGVRDVSEKNAFTSITQATISEFGPDIVHAFEKLKFPREKAEKFVKMLQFDSQGGDMILVVNNQHRTQLISEFETFLPVGNKNAFYVFGPATMQKFIQLMAQDQNLEGRYSPSYFREVHFDLIHGLGKPEDFYDITKRAVTIPNPFVGKDSVHGDASLNNGLGVYLHDVNYHILSVSCRIPLSHAAIYSRLASFLQDRCPRHSRQFLDMNFPFYNPVTPLSTDPLEDYQLLQFGLVVVRDPILAIRNPLFIDPKLEEYVLESLSYIPGELKSAGVVLEKNELKEAQPI